MPDGTGGLAAGIYWVATGKLPVEDLAEKPKEKPKTPKDRKS